MHSALILIAICDAILKERELRRPHELFPFETASLGLDLNPYDHKIFAVNAELLISFTPTKSNGIALVQGAHGRHQRPRPPFGGAPNAHRPGGRLGRLDGSI